MASISPRRRPRSSRICPLLEKKRIFACVVASVIKGKIWRVFISVLTTSVKRRRRGSARGPGRPLWRDLEGGPRHRAHLWPRGSPLVTPVLVLFSLTKTDPGFFLELIELRKVPETQKYEKGGFLPPIIKYQNIGTLEESPLNTLKLDK